MGGARYAGVLQHHAAARLDLRERGRGPSHLHRIRRGLRDLLQGPRREISGTEGRHTAQDLNSPPLPIAFRVPRAYHTLWSYRGGASRQRAREARRMPKIQLDFGSANPIIAAIRAPVRLSAKRTVKPGPNAFGDRILDCKPPAKEVIMTSKREHCGSQDFFALDIPVT